MTTTTPMEEDEEEVGKIASFLSSISSGGIVGMPLVLLLRFQTGDLLLLLLVAISCHL